MIEKSQKLFSLNHMEDKGRKEGNENGLSGLGRTLVLSTISPGRDIGCIDWAEHQD